ncbi:XRE family transcriptional regulator [Rhizobium sullae]|uniref:XRE family transcriptional regulator n=1 Tax=Rhizobium sullae TaxID=50338 RepID=A0A2N0D3I7_RHISU|nr:helix-turn-helix transcriptional regulator [Rhizobium sullae]PKA40649.1 XRE family transcriptional regulator [Rhizobium sullae]
MLLAEQAKRGLTDYKAAKEIGVLQQTYSSWKHGSIPRPNRYAAVAGWLGISIDTARELCEEERPSVVGDEPLGRISDRKEGKFKFAGIPTSRYAIVVDTKVMEPALPVGTKAWLDPAVWPAVGNEVIVHAKGTAWLGRLVSIDGGNAVVSNDAGTTTVRDVQAIHVVILSERLAAS